MVRQIGAGQVGLMLLVIMSVVIALVMSVASRSLSDTMLSRQEKESSAAFEVAETGIEQALNRLRQGSLPAPTQFFDSTGLVTGNYAVNNLTTYSLYVKELETAQLDLTGFGGGNLTVKWTKKNDVSEDKTTCSEGSGTMSAALEISAIKSGTNVIERSYYNPFDCNISGNNFASSLTGGDYVSSINYVVPANTTSLRLRPIYLGATISVMGALTADQMYIIQASGSGGDAQKEIQVKRGLDAPASVFDFALFSGTTIVK
ncbi:MAG: hypothetical protein V1487_03970 [bacterium]